MFKAEKWDPDHWTDLFQKAGAEYVVPVAEHHDGFAMYDCSFTKWNAVDMGPRRDVVGELAKAVREWERKEDGLLIQLPDTKSCEHAFAFKIKLG